MNKRLVVAILAGAVAGEGFGGVATGQPKDAGTGEKASTYKVVPHSDTQFAHELLQLDQPDLIKAVEASSKGSASENMWKAQAIAGNWLEISKIPADTAKATIDYLAAMKAYTAANPEGIDGIWALDHAKFIFGQLSQRVMVRMENYGNSAKDREALAPMAELADKLLTDSASSLDAGQKYYEGHTPFDETAYMRVLGSIAEVEYYNVWGKYFKAMAMEPGNAKRRDILLKAAEDLAHWADDATDNGVNKQALLLRGKLRSEAGQLSQAVDDLKKAIQDGPETVKSPDWVKYQARYQIIVTRIRSKDFATAFEEYKTFKGTLPADNKIAQMSAEMLRYRITWAEAETKTGKDQKDEQLKALAILGEIIKTEPGFRTLIFDQLGAQIPENAKLEELLPMQQLAIAYSKSQGQSGDTQASKDALKEAIKACLAVRGNASASQADKMEAIYLAGLCSEALHDDVAAVQFDVEYTEMAPKDEATKKVLERALATIGSLKDKPAGQTPEMKALMTKALTLSTTKFNDPRFLWALGVILEKDGKHEEASACFKKIPQTDPKYIDAQYMMVNIALARFTQLSAKKSSEVPAAATELFNTSGKFVSLLDNPPAGLDPKALEKARVFRTDILMIETSVALDPNVKRLDTAKDRLAKLDKVRNSLPAIQQGAILRYEIQLLQMSNGSAEEIMKKVDDYAKTSGKDPVEVIKGLAFSTLDEITKAEGAGDKDKAKSLAEFVVKLFDPIIASKASDKKASFELREVKADLMVRAGDYKGAEELCLKLQEEEPARLSAFMTEARAFYVQAEQTSDDKKYREALDYFQRILPRLTPTNDSYWESWLRIIQCMEKIRGAAATDDIKKKLGDLKGSTSNMGGEAYKEEFLRLMAKYGVK